VARWGALLLFGFYGAAAVGLLYLRFFDPLTTGVQIERRVQAWWTWSDYDKRWEVVPLAQISPNLAHAVIAAEDARFYQHRGLDWFEMQKVMKESQQRGHVTRGASTITQQLVKNLFLTTSSTWIRKVLEIPLALLAELLLPKQRILELYLNVVEWGPGVYGAEAAAQYQ
jgi:monofunctional glycosyltransferase